MTDLERELVDALERTETIVERMVYALRQAGAYDERLSEDVFERQKRNMELPARASGQLVPVPGSRRCAPSGRGSRQERLRESALMNRRRARRQVWRICTTLPKVLE